MKGEKHSRIPCAIVRGGTSKGVIIEKRYLPEDPILRDFIITDIFGSESHGQIDGLGGATPLTSKVAIVEKSDQPGIDVNYTFGQVCIESNDIDYSINCGNISAAVGLFSIQENLVPTQRLHTPIRILNTNSNRLITAQITNNDEITKAKEKDYLLSEASISLVFENPVGAKTGKLLPTGKVVDYIKLSNLRSIQVSVVDSGTVYIFIDAAQLQISGIEKILEIEKNTQLLQSLKKIKSKVRGLIFDNCKPQHINIKVALVSPAQPFKTEDGQKIKSGEIQIISKIVNFNKVHTAYAVTGAVCLSTAMLIKGTVIEKIQIGFKESSKKVRIGHPSGIIEAKLEYYRENQELVIKNINITRTARRIMDGFVYLKSPYQVNKYTK